MAVTIHKHPFEARRRLAELGVSYEALVDAVNSGYRARLNCTDNDPPFIPGTEAWRHTVRTLRERLLPLGWRKADPGNYSLVISDARKINIVVASADAMTCRADASPKTNSIKGLYTLAATIRNRAGEDLFPETLEEEVRRAATVLEYPTWLLLIHIEDEVARAELSLSGAMEDGQVVEWLERIFLPDLVDGGTEISIDGSPSDADNVDVPVRRKA